MAAKYAGGERGGGVGETSAIQLSLFLSLSFSCSPSLVQVFGAGKGGEGSEKKQEGCLFFLSFSIFFTVVLAINLFLYFSAHFVLTTVLWY